MGVTNGGVIKGAVETGGVLFGTAEDTGGFAGLAVGTWQERTKMNKDSVTNAIDIILMDNMFPYLQEILKRGYLEFILSEKKRRVKSELL